MKKKNATAGKKILASCNTTLVSVLLEFPMPMSITLGVKY